ncbi:hypothetical protein BGX28_004794 [Mortierella sp. GBA30]|nr:hypothetical protein BGX28_004794 [Mortierella sp. GBA30]
MSTHTGDRQPPRESEPSRSHIQEDTPLLRPLSRDSSNTPDADPTSIYVKVLADHLPWFKRPSAAWFFPLSILIAVSGGMLSSSIGQFRASLLCREYMNRHGPTNTTVLIAADMTSLFVSAANEGMVFLRPAPECETPEIQAFTAKTLGMIEVLGAIAGMVSVGYWASLSDKHGRTRVMLVTSVNAFFMVAAIIAMGRWWDQIGLPLMVAASLVSGLLGGVGLVGALGLAYAADCTDPSRRSLVYSWLHAGFFLGLAIGSFLGGALFRATGSIMIIIYIDIVAAAIAVIMLVFFIPESLPTKQSTSIQALYEKAVRPYKKNDTTPNTNSREQRLAWHSHMFQALEFFKPNGSNTNLIILGIISFLQMLALHGTLSIIILYTNKMFQWTEYEDGILFSLSSTVRLLALLIFLPILVHIYHKLAVKRSHHKGSDARAYATSDGHNSGRNQRRHFETDEDEDNSSQPGPRAIGLEDPAVASSLEHLGEAVLNLSDDEDSFEERRRRLSTVDSARTLSSPYGKDSTSKTKSTPSTSTSISSSTMQTEDQRQSNLKLDTWIIRLGFAINSVTYIGYGLSTEGWMFCLWSSLHALSIIASPSIKSLLTSLVEPSQFGAILGAIQVVDSIAGVFSPLVISWVYAATVHTRPDFVWYCCAALTGTCMILSFMIRQKQFVRGTIGV